MSSDLGALAARVRDAKAAHEAKKDEITAAGGDDEDDVVASAARRQ